MQKIFLMPLLTAYIGCMTSVAFSSTLPEKGAASTTPASRWEEAFMTGNGRMGAMLFGNVQNETLVANHCRLFLPLGSRELVPDLSKYLPELRRIIRRDGYQAAMSFLMDKAGEQGFPGLLPTDPLHPGFFVRIKQTPSGKARDYLRTENFRSGEVAVTWSDDRETFSRRLFVSRPDNVIVFSITSDRKGQIECELEFPLPTPVERKTNDNGWRANVRSNLIISERSISRDLVTFHNTYAKGKGGYDVAVRIIPDGGQTRVVDDRVQIKGADGVLMLMRIVPWKTPLSRKESEAWAYCAENPDFKERAGKFEPVPALGDSSVVPYQTQQKAAALLPQLVKSLKILKADYGRLYDSHHKQHAALFDRVSLDLGGGEDRNKSSEELLATAVKEQRLPNALMEKIYDAGRYMYICSAGELPPNLQGIWTGSWIPAWSGDFTLDTNVQLAMKHAFTGNLGELMEGYYRMIEGFYPEWKLNAERTYGCPGYLTNARASNTALLLHWGKWPGVFWTGGCGWLAHFFYDHWQFTGDEAFLRERTVPLLKEVVAFYEYFMLLDPSTGRYEFIPSYSPETGTGITATMDVMVCKDALKSLIHACRILDIDKENIPKWEAMLGRLPEYRINEDGALAEWVPEGGPERYKHRHLSHLHSCYEALDDLDPERSPKLWAAAQEATRRRIHSGGEVSSHGRVHMGLAAAFLRMPEEAYSRLEVMATGKSMYASLMCSHEPNAKIFNLDANGAIPEILHRMLLQSSPGMLDLLPALPKAWPRGEIRGIKARRQITINRLAWDQTARQLTLKLTSERDQKIVLRMPHTRSIRRITTTRDPADIKTTAGSPNQRAVVLKKGKTVDFRIYY